MFTVAVENSSSKDLLSFALRSYRVLKGPGGVQGEGVINWGTLRIPAGKIGEP